MLSRIKFEINTLVSEILDQLPAQIWTDKHTTFLDPAMAGGQFVQQIEQRLRRAGHSDHNIKSRVFGCEQFEHQVVYAVNKFKLIGNYAPCKFLEKDFENMKFDVVIGNPPYQSGKGEKGGKHSLWRKFVKKSFDLVEKDGYVAMVCPGFPYQANDLSNCFTDNTPCVLVNDAKHHFPAVGSDIKYWIVKQGKHKIPFLVDGNHWPNGLKDDPTSNPFVVSIKAKLAGLPTFECKQDKGYNSTQFKNDSSDYFETPKGKSIYPIRHASTIKICYVSKPTDCHYKNKVMMTFSGYPSFEYYEGSTNPISSCYQMSGYIEVADSKQGQALISLYSTKFYTFLSNLDGAGMKGIANYSLPKVPLNKNWTDQDLYQHFGLTQDEIDYIEDNSK